MKLKRNIIISVIAFVLVIAVLVSVYLYEYARIDYATIDYIKGLQKSPNNFLDLSGDIGVTSYEDLGFEQKSDYDLIIHYGKQIVKVNKWCLESEEWRNRVGSIGLKIYSRIDPETEKRVYRITYWEDEIEQWSRVD